ncbi:uncharacterized protein LOC122629684 [Vespula pensylvanica]|uniref:Chitin-binding type-2 domain-containing protein n=1 Tax=Vespula pensylvanica TaxID=30213 RepID=A0A834UBJ3_VESPE|nr:uncharacterized protein LOC122629684 [Vespula pensylvanica]XP_043669332.1 uncharacterized protein LOC122629684 [Vespula pensylvanica]KAF7427638.1 hypothetical protein H0235_007332 [Vespula pensylvanica]
MEVRVESWILGVVLHYTVFIVLVHPEEVFNTTPPPLRTNFSCFGRAMGFYADVEADCKVYHTCDDHGNKFSYRCPEETAFRQDALICDHARLVDCRATTYDDKKSLRGSRSEEESLGLNVPSLFNIPPPLDNSNNHRSFSRSFQVIQRPDKSSTDKTQPGFVFSASVFLRNQQDHDLHRKSMNKQETESILDQSRCNRNEEHKTTGSSSKNQVSHFSSTPRPFSRDSYKQDSSLPNRFPSFTRSDSETKNLLGRTFVNVPMISAKTQPPRKDFFHTTTVFSLSTKLPTNDIPRLNSNTYNNRDYPYFETLRSIQANAMSTSTPRTTIATTEIPVHALTMSLKPLVPNELEYDPYYPRIPTSTEAYYTASHLNKDSESFRFTTQPPWSGIHFEIPAVLPDLNTLEDLVDRRKLFYIPRVTRH